MRRVRALAALLFLFGTLSSRGVQAVAASLGGAAAPRGPSVSGKATPSPILRRVGLMPRQDRRPSRLPRQGAPDGVCAPPVRVVPATLRAASPAWAPPAPAPESSRASRTRSRAPPVLAA